MRCPHPSPIDAHRDGEMTARGARHFATLAATQVKSRLYRALAESISHFESLLFK
jgi:hypothetical protein